MDDLISRQAAIDCEYQVKIINDIEYVMLSEVQMKMRKLPSAEPQRMKGRWERHYSRPNVYADLCWHCSNCGYSSNDSWANKWKYCPNCGADMRGEQDGSNKD